jgi:membrane protease YdiL (CAAX protease family)
MISPQTNKFSHYKEIVITTTVILLCLTLSFLFPAQNTFQDLSKGIFFLILLPYLYIRFILKRKMSDFGLNLKNNQEGLLWGIFMFFFSLLIFYLLFNYTGFKTGYTLPNSIVQNFWLFLLYELFFVTLSCFVNEFFFRGFILFYFSREIFEWIVPIQALLYALILVLIGNFSWQMAPALAISLISGIITYRSNSFVYSFIASIFSIIILDSFIIYHLK